MDGAQRAHRTGPVPDRIGAVGTRGAYEGHPTPIDSVAMTATTRDEATTALTVALEDARDGAVLRFAGRLDAGTVATHWREARRRATGASGSLRLDLTELEALDGAGAALLVQLSRDLAREGRDGALVGATGPVAALLDLYAPKEKVPPPRPEELHESFLAHVGRRSIGATEDFVSGIAFIGAFTRASLAAALRPTTFPLRDWVVQLSRTGPDGVAIVALVNFLVGTILGFQSAVQLERYGAELFVANLVGLSVVRELGPLMTAILLAGRSGAAFAAELGTMRVSEEVDALRTMGLSPQRFLVLPRVAALAITAPLLTIIADAMGILGGLAIGCGVMGLTLNAYWIQTATSIETVDVVTGLVKAVFFGGIVGLVACHRGLSTSGGAEGVGRSTTAAVVTVLFALIVADALFTYLFTLYGL